MDTPTIKTVITEDDLLRMGAEDRRVEVIGGEIVEMSPVGIQHSDIAGNVYDLLKTFVKVQQLGHVFTGSLIYVLDVDSESGVRTSRIPDASFIRRGRLPKRGDDRARPFPGAPDLAVEVVSPGEGADELQAKIRDYLTFGSEQVWMLYPNQRELHQYIRGEKASHIYTESDTISGDDLLPGLSVLVGDFFIEPDDEG